MSAGSRHSEDEPASRTTKVSSYLMTTHSTVSDCNEVTATARQDMTVSKLTALDAARAYVRRGYAPIPVEYRTKKSYLKDWQNLRLTEADVARYFGDGPVNVGLSLGTASRGVVDIDLDCHEAVVLAQTFLPPTASIFGRKTRSLGHG